MFLYVYLAVFVSNSLPFLPISFPPLSHTHTNKHSYIFVSLSLYPSVSILCLLHTQREEHVLLSSKKRQIAKPFEQQLNF